MIQTEYKDSTISFGIGDLIKPKEPNDLEAIVAKEDVVVGTFVKLINENGKDLITNLDSDSKESDIYGIVVNDVKNVGSVAVEMYGMADVRIIKEGQTALVARISSKLSIAPFLTIGDSIASISEAFLYVCKSHHSINNVEYGVGTLCVLKDAPTGDDAKNYIPLPKTMFRLRGNQNSASEVYLEVAQQVPVPPPTPGS